ncbi:transporter [Amycolatopsis sp. NPDC059027]|uniref:transporter n=1 Tax=Amycolatopsis sp. NPDC059027 TaxID=3346709 RepID=UPI00366D0B3C
MHSRRPMNAARKLALAALALVSISLSVATPAAQAATPTVGERNTPAPITFDTCYAPNATGPWTKNRFGSCTKTRLSYKRYACPDAGCAVDGTASAFVTTISNLVPGTRQVLVGHQMGGFYTDLPETTRIGLAIECVPKNTSGTARCDQPSATIVKSIAEWRTQMNEFTTLAFDGEDLPDPAQPPEIQAEKRTGYTLSYRMFVEEPPGTRSELTTGASSFGVRCDVVRQLNPSYGRGADCAFPHETYFYVDRADALNAESARLISDGIVGSSAAYPPLGGGWFIPGYPGVGGREVWRRPLTRQYYDTASQQAHRAVAENSCVTRWGPDYQQRPGGGTNVCAAFPFDATRQGATPRGGTPGPTYVVRPVATADYQELLTRLQTFLADNHILDGDNYWVYPVN